MSAHPPACVLITGAAKRVGAVLARHLAAKGHNLVLHYGRSRDEAETLAAELRRAHGISVTCIGADFLDSEATARFWDTLPPVTHLVHNASRYTRDRQEDFSAAELRAHLAVNFEVPLLLTQGFARQLPPGIQGTVTVLGDGVKGWSISPGFYSYAMSKLIWESAIDLLAASLAPRIRANLIALAPTLEGAMDEPSTFARLAAHAPLARTGTPPEVCAALDYLMAAEGVTGQILSLAGGFGLTSWRHPAKATA